MIDASVIVEYLLTKAASEISVLLREQDVDLAVPSLCDVEVVAALRRALQRNLLTDARAVLAIGQYLQMPLSRYGHSRLLPRIIELRSNFSAYDACYVALAERLDADFLTADQKLASAVRTHTVVRVVGSWGS